VAAIQTNFGEQDVTYGGGRGTSFSHKYKIEGSSDTSGAWTMIIDKTANTKDVSHDYVVLDSIVNFRFIRITNAGTMPGNGKFAIRDLRIFGSDKSSLPQKVNDFSVSRSASDTRMVTLSWSGVSDADGYIIRFGTAPTKLFNNYQVMDKNTVSYTLRSLNTGVQYFYSIDSYNAGGVANGTLIKNDSNITATVNELAATRSRASSGRIYRMFGQLSVPQEYLHKSCAMSIYDCSGKQVAYTALTHGRVDLPHSFSRVVKVYLVRVISTP
jgi:hypothetical protein